jgi:prepilin-type N-terminal cleavage/methylation domain-containing protein
MPTIPRPRAVTEHRARPSDPVAAPAAGQLDDGFTLLEVVVSLMVMGVVMASLTTFMATTIRVANLQTEQQLAAEVAAGAMEKVHRMDPSGLLKDRDKASVDAAYDNLASPELAPYLTDMERAWDSTAAPGTGDLGTTRVRTNTQSVRLNGIWYNKRYYVGRCWQSTSGGPCDTSSTTGVEYFRVVVIVSWGNGLCPANACLYVISALISNAPSDPVFNSNLSPTVSPVANQNTTVGTPATPVTSSYTGGTSPIVWSITGQPPGMTVTSSGKVSGTPTAAGTYTVTCRAIDGNGEIGSATFTWTVS